MRGPKDPAPHHSTAPAAQALLQGTARNVGTGIGNRKTMKHLMINDVKRCEKVFVDFHIIPLTLIANSTKNEKQMLASLIWRTGQTLHDFTILHAAAWAAWIDQIC